MQAGSVWTARQSFWHGYWRALEDCAHTDTTRPGQGPRESLAFVAGWLNPESTENGRAFRAGWLAGVAFYTRAFSEVS
jgi:hypothetical protein